MGLDDCLGGGGGLYGLELQGQMLLDHDSPTQLNASQSTLVYSFVERFELRNLMNG